MSHIGNAPLRPRRHSDAAFDSLKLKNHHQDSHAYNDSTLPSSSSSSSSSRSLRQLLLPAQLELRRVTAARTQQKLSSTPKRYSTDTSFRLHRLVARQSSPSTDFGGVLDGVTGSTSCRGIVTSYEGTAEKQVALRRACGRAVLAAREEEEEAAASASASTSRSATVTAATRTTTSRLQTITVSSARTGRVLPALSTLNPTENLSSAISSRFGAAASAVASVEAASSASRAAIQTSVESLFSAAASEISSRKAAATASSAISSSSSTSLSSSASSSLPSSSSTTPSSTISGAGASATASYPNDDNRLVKIVVPSVVIPVVCILLLLLALFCLRRKRRRNAATGLAISHPQPMRANPRVYDATGTGAALAGAGAAGAAGGAGAAGAGNSQESFGTTPSAIGVAFSEPRTRWGRRSLVDVLAGAVRATSPTNDSSPRPSAGGSHDRHLAQSQMSHHGRQPSIMSAPSISSEYRGVGGYNSWTGYQPGMPRPVMTPISQHYDPYGPASIVAVPASAQRQHQHSSSEGSQSGYGASGSARSRSTVSGGSISESITARLAPPLAAGYAHAAAAQQSRTTQTDEGGYWTADPGVSSQDDGSAQEALSDDFHGGSPEEEAVNFGSSSGSGSGSRSGGSRSGSDNNMTPRVGSAHSMASTPRLGAGHGSGSGVRRHDGTGSWWN
ncbi:hypothetical protein JCM8547_007944 [Rhodosporidiobolus lusitaniae]